MVNEFFFVLIVWRVRCGVAYEGGARSGGVVGRDEEGEGEFGRTIPRGACERRGKFLLPLSLWPRRLVVAHEKGTRD